MNPVNAQLSEKDSMVNIQGEQNKYLKDTHIT